MATFTITALLSEARRRRVFRVAALYVVGAWITLQAADLAFPGLGIPESAILYVWMGAILGLPVALFFGWRYDIRGGRIVRTVDSNIDTDVSIRLADYVILTALSAVVAMIAFELVGEISKTRIAERAPIAITNVDPNSIAVLPFVNISDDPGNVYFAEGMSEEIRNLLGKFPGLKVIGRTSSITFRGRNEDLRVIGQTLGVRTLLEGSVRKSGDQVRITTQLVDASDGAQIWSETYNRTMTDIFALQDDVAAAIADALQIHVGVVPTRGRPTESPIAYALFLKARAAVNVIEYPDAEELLLEAIELDPKFAEAYELLSFTYSIGYMGGVETQRLVGEAAAKAIDLDPGLVLARTLYQFSEFGPYTHLRSLQAYDLGAREQPDNPEILDGLTFLLMEYGYLEEAVRAAERYVELDPLSLIALSYRAATLYAVGRDSEAVAALEFANPPDLDPSYFKWIFAGVNLVENQDETAIKHFEFWLQQHDYPEPTWFRELVTAARDPESGQATLDRRIPQIVASMAEVDALRWQRGLTSLYLYFGFLDRYFELILATEPNDTSWHFAGTHVLQGTIVRRLGFTAHPRYLEIAEIMGFFHIWEQRGPPDFCEKVGGEWVCE